ncbi:MAG: hypothetical protein HYX68_13605 [Planctomycetes bacterium]|nr:hypothetical protein [Planctomycetota bacterium]
MTWGSLLRHWTMQTIHSAVLGAALLGSAGVAVAQAPKAVPTQAPAHYAKTQGFDLPVHMEPADRLAISEFRLYVKTPTSGWKLQESGNQNLTRFSCKVAQDGEYWYTLATVDKAGRMDPPDVNLAAPSQRVIVDTVAPIIQVQSWTSPQNDLCLRCTVTDVNPDMTTLRAICRTSAGDVALEAFPNQPNTFRLKGGELLRFPVVITVRDLAGHVATKEVNVRELIGSALAPVAPKAAPTKIEQASVVPDPKIAPMPQPDLPMPRLDMLPAFKNEGPTRVSDFSPSGLPQGSPLPIQPPGGLPQPEIQKTGQSTPAPLPSPQQADGPRQLINTTHAAIEYRIDQVGPSGVGKVEVFMTPDKGQTWHRLGEDTDKRSPAEVNLPGDGVFGIRIVVTNGNGFGGRAPVRGDLPHCTVEVDTTSPFVQLRSAEVLPGSGQVELRWNATDNNLSAEPVNLFYRTRADGAWQVIARNVKNDGVHRWTFPRDAGPQFFVKIEVTDRAGNLAQDSSRQPILIDLTEPRATVLGVTGSTSPRRP